MIARRPVMRAVVQSTNQSIQRSLKPLTTRSLSTLSNPRKYLTTGNAVLTGICALTLAAFHTTASSNLENVPITQSSAGAPVSELPVDQLKSTYKSSADFKNRASVVLYQYQTCPFCNKLRAFLDYEKIPYEIVEVDPMSKKQIKFAAPYKAVPVLTVDGFTLADSSPIIDQLVNTMKALDNKPLQQSNPDDLKWREWVDTDLIYLTAPNLYTSLSASLDAMDYIMRASGLPAGRRYISKYVGGPVMYLVSEYQLKKKRNITDPRGQLYAACREFAESRKGKKDIQLSDITAFGVCRAFSGFPAGEDIMNPSNTSQQFVDWFNRMKTVVGKSSAKTHTGMGVGADYVDAQ